MVTSHRIPSTVWRAYGAPQLMRSVMRSEH